MAVGGKGLRAVQHPVFAIAHGSGAIICCVGAGFRLGERPRAEFLAMSEREPGSRSKSVSGNVYDLSKVFLTLTAQDAMDPIQRLSDDILIYILSYLSYPELTSAQRVSKRWLHYFATVPHLHRKVSFLNSKHQITLKTLRAVLSMANGHISSLEFDADTLLYLTPLVRIYPHLRRLIIEHKNGVMSTIFNIAFQLPNGLYHNLPSLRTAVFHHGMLLNNEIVTLITMAPNLEELECHKAVTWLDRLELMSFCKIKRLRIKGYSERSAGPAWDVRFPVSRRSPLILQYLPDLEELVLGLDSLLVMDLTMNPKIRYLDFLPGSSVISFIQPPPGLEVCLNTPQLCGFNFDIETPLVSQSDQGDRRLQLWTNPPRFKSMSMGLVRPAGLPRALCNSYESLVAVSFGPPHDFRGWLHANPYPDTRKMQLMETLIDVLAMFQNLLFLDLATTIFSDSFLLRLQTARLEYLSLAHTLVTTDGVLQFFEIPTALKGLNLVGTAVGVEVMEVAQSLGVKMETEYPGKPMPGALYSLY